MFGCQAKTRTDFRNKFSNMFEIISLLCYNLIMKQVMNIKER
ncbi:hypothetical protein HMPREF0373_00760 [Eubacterium ramulus ATCC 29099]|uniref:Uncharacterized protein n=1 Tax=Eubacterium ramulus ATCC 29099 TaxID=1256908 RepID=U2RA90_EUBRA|nr:hypothetical protein HMPREF0373_00760 [Eubacterium ramulus ATCC 29099]